MVRGRSLMSLVLLWCLLAGMSSAASENGAKAFCPAYDYEEALSKAILFFEGQRAGKLPASQRAEWRGDSALSDGKPDNVNLMGGYYDAGDNIKFVWPMAFSTSLLSWAAIEYQQEIVLANQFGYLRKAIRWATNFFLRAHISSNTLYTQVGDGNADHQCWERPEDMDTPRTLYKITCSSPGTEVAAETAAAFAAASIVFSKSDFNYSARLLRHSKLLFQFADNYRGSYHDSCPFYCSYSGYQDELLWAAAWLYKATGENSYLEYVTRNQEWSQSVSEFSWDNKHAGAQMLLAKEFFGGKISLGRYKNGADSFVCALMPGSSSVQIQRTPGGLLYTRDSGNLQYVTSASMLLLVYTKILNAAKILKVECGSVNFSSTQIKAFAKSQVDYILGNNPLKKSYMVAFGSNYPAQLHHRGASIPSIHTYVAKVGCNDGYSEWYYSSKPNPNIHVGALVGGPDSNDQFKDLRSDYSHSEPTTYTNAAFVGSVAGLLGESGEVFVQMKINETQNMGDDTM